MSNDTKDDDKPATLHGSRKQEYLDALNAQRPDDATKDEDGRPLPPTEATMVRIAGALELIALQAITGAKTNSSEVIGAMMELRERIAARHR